ncbi:related to Putative dipeptidase ARB_02715 [Phialocephala subalpina]|uniref:Dipeptidase n=1 Tax=Phialocephala subalpina TaxID=576137 RepID=A0A1L7XN14_9HELO|nr:related to Putative dipeptidase ARB_02715 [Phialocephala subalpina]
MKGIRTAVAALALSQMPSFAFADADTDELYARAIKLMSESPLIDTHIDLPQIIRGLDRNPLSILPNLAASLPGHVDIPKMREGHLGGAFFTVWAPCADFVGQSYGPNFLGMTEGLRDSLEVLDIIKRMIEQHPNDLSYAYSSSSIKSAFHSGKIASLIGMEGTHLLGNSLSTVRLFAEMGVKYLTLTHTCHSSFAASNGGGGPVEASSHGPGLTEFGKELVGELNRLGVMVDLSHTSDQTTRDAIALSKAPVVWTHAGARAVQDHPRNVPDDILKLIGDGERKNSGIILSVFYPVFIGPTPETANVSRVADHIEHIASIVGRNHVGIASDFDGMYAGVHGLEDASKYPNLIVELLSRGWNDTEIYGVMGENLMRVMDQVDAVKQQMKDELPSTAIWERRNDLPANWGGPEQAYLPYEVRDLVNERIKHDEL